MPPKRDIRPKDSPKKEEQKPKVEEKPVEEPPEEELMKQPSDDEFQQPLDEDALKKKKQIDMFKKYLDQTGIAMAFQVIFAEILDKKVEEKKLFSYTAMRLRQIGEDLEKIKTKK